MLYVPVNSSCHVGMLPPLYGTFTQKEDVMTSNKCFVATISSHNAMCEWFDLKPLFLGKLRPERLTSNQSEQALPGGTSSPSIV